MHKTSKKIEKHFLPFNCFLIKKSLFSSKGIPSNNCFDKVSTCTAKGCLTPEVHVFRVLTSFFGVVYLTCQQRISVRSKAKPGLMRQVRSREIFTLIRFLFTNKRFGRSLFCRNWKPKAFKKSKVQIKTESNEKNRERNSLIFNGQTLPFLLFFT